MNDKIALRVGYARVSSKEQNLDRQIDALKQYVDRPLIFCDKMSGKNFDRPEYKRVRMLLENGGVLYVKSLDRLGRNKAAVLEELRWYKQHGVMVRILDLPTTMIQMDEGNSWMMELINDLMIQLLSTFAEQERVNIRQRQREGIDAAKARGKHLGRKPVEMPEGMEILLEKLEQGLMTSADVMRQTGLKKSTFYRILKDWREKG